MSASPSPSLLSRSARWLRFYAAGLLALPASVAIVVSLFLPWLTLSISACLIGRCTPGASQTFSLVDILAAHGLIILVGGPLTALLPLVAGYAPLALWSVATALCGLIFAISRFSARRPAASIFSTKPPQRSWLAVLFCLVLVVLVLITLFQLFGILALESAVRIAVFHLTGGSLTQPGPLLLLASLIVLGVAAALGLRAAWSTRRSS